MSLLILSRGRPANPGSQSDPFVNYPITGYAAPSATGGGDGTLGNPWTWNEARSNSTAGERILFRGGTFQIDASNLENEWTTNGTSSSARAVFQNYPGELPILDANVAGGGSTDQQAAVNMKGAWQVLRGFHIESSTGQAAKGVHYVGTDGLVEFVTVIDVIEQNPSAADNAESISVGVNAGGGDRITIRLSYLDGVWDNTGEPNTHFNTALIKGYSAETASIYLNRFRNTLIAVEPKAGLDGNPNWDVAWNVTLPGDGIEFFYKGSSAHQSQGRQFRYNIAGVEVAFTHLGNQHCDNSTCQFGAHTWLGNTIIVDSAPTGGESFHEGTLKMRNRSPANNSNWNGSVIHTLKDNLIWHIAGGGDFVHIGSQNLSTGVDWNYNGYSKPSGAGGWHENGSDYSTVSAWSAGATTTVDANSTFSNTDPFVNLAGEDFTTTGWASTAAEDGGPLGATGGTAQDWKDVASEAGITGITGEFYDFVKSYAGTQGAYTEIP